MENEKRRAEDAERLPAEKLVWPREVTPTGPTTGWCGTCGCGNDAAGFAHLVPCPAAPAVDAAKLTEDERDSLLVQVENYMAVVDMAGSQGYATSLKAEAEIYEHVAALIAKRAPTALPVDAAELGKLKALAEAATQGPWHVTKYCSVMDDGMETLVVSSDSSHEDRAFIAAANPAAILRIAALVAQQAARIEELNWWEARAENHNETLRSIAKMDPATDGERMRRWALDGLTGYTETNDQTMAKLMDQVAQQAVRIAELSGALQEAIWTIEGTDNPGNSFLKRLREIQEGK